MMSASLRRMSKVIVAGLMLSAASVYAQSPKEKSESCEAANAPIEEDGPNYLQVTCGQMAVMLGRVESYEFTPLPALDAGIVVIEFGGVRRAWLITHDGGSDIALEEITGTIASLVGRGERRDITGLELDFGEPIRGRTTAVIRSKGAGSASLDVSGLVKRSRALRTNAYPRGVN